MRFKRLLKEIDISNDEKGKIIVHISDTPSLIISQIINMVNKLGADYLIHTGDFVDELKSDHPLFSEKIYQQRLERLIKRFVSSEVGNIVLVPGNHDNLDFVRDIPEKVKILPEGSILDIGELTLSVAHTFENLRVVNGIKNNTVYLYGHNRYRVNAENYLNGYCCINILFTNPFKVYKINYPFFTELLRGNYDIFKKGL